MKTDVPGGKHPSWLRLSQGLIKRQSIVTKALFRITLDLWSEAEERDCRNNSFSTGRRSATEGQCVWVSFQLFIQSCFSLSHFSQVKTTKQNKKNSKHGPVRLTTNYLLPAFITSVLYSIKAKLDIAQLHGKKKHPFLSACTVCCYSDSEHKWFAVLISRTV